MSATLFAGDDALADRLRRSPLVVMLDVDGTLSPIASRPNAATVPHETQRAVAALAARPGVRVVLVSGRAARNARRIVSVSNVWVIGNHGFEVTGPQGEELLSGNSGDARPIVARAARRLMPLLADVPGVILEDKVWTLSVHFRLADPAVVPKLRTTVEEAIAPLDLRLTDGKMVFEIRPTARVDKGTAVLWVRQELGGGEGALLYVGDDTTDEDAFRALRALAPDAVTVRVTDDPMLATAAEFTLPDPAAVRGFLEWLLEVRS